MITDVYAKINSDNVIIDIAGEDGENCVLLEKNFECSEAAVKFGYLSEPVYDEYGRYNFRLIDGKVEEIPEEDKPPVPAPEPAPPSNAELAAAVAELAGVMFNG